MQLGVPQLKGLLRQAAGAERRRLLLALLARDAACVGFAVVLISALTALFGGANSPAAVVIFCLLLSCRFVHYNYRMADTLRNMAAAFALLTLGPALAPLGGPLLHLLLNLFCIGVLLLITADQPELGNASLYLFSYLFLYGNPVSGRSLALRGLEMLLGFALCAAVLYHNHRGRTPERPFRAVLRAFSLADEKCRWQLRVAVGISLAVLTGELLGLPRIMWVGFSCSSILTAYGSHPVRRAAGRVGGVLGGSLLQKPTIPVMLLSTFVAGLESVFIQRVALGDVLKATVNGFNVSMIHRAGFDTETCSEAVTKLLNRGGMNGIMSTTLLVFCAFCFAGIMSRTGCLDVVLQKILSVAKSTGALITATVAACITMALTTGNSYLAILIPGEMFRDAYKERGLAAKNLSRTLEDAGTVVVPLIPWSAAGAYMASTLGVETLDYLPWAILCYTGWIFAIIWGFTGFGIAKLDDEKKKEN